MSKSVCSKLDIGIAVAHLRSADPILRKVISDEADYRAYHKRTSFESLVRIVIGQQLSAQAARTIFNRFKAAVHGKGITPQSVNTLDDSEFALAGISRSKTRTIKMLVSEILSGRLSFRRIARMSDDKIMDELTKITGIGPWTVQMYLMFVLRRPDVFPHSDTGITNAIKELYSHGSHPVNAEYISDRWRPFRTVACWFLWRHIDKRLC